MIIETEISWGYLPLIQTFASANNLSLEYTCRNVEVNTGIHSQRQRQYITVSCEDGSETELSITFMSVKHLGFRNMLYDYLHKCHIDNAMIPIGKFVMRKSSEQMEKEWQQHRKEIGLAR
jgi:hypothetical protein